jgi:dephospho-CoA kinase
MVRIGVTGLMASGKSSVARRFEERGAVRIDGDALGWETLRDSEVRSRIANAFGPEVQGPDGEVDRARLGARVFADPREMERLNAIVQPPLRERVLAAIAAVESQRAPGAAVGAGHPSVVVLDAALISTWALESELDGVVEVTAYEPLRIARLQGSGRVTEKEAAARVRGQSLPPLGAAARIWRIENQGNEATLLADADRVWNEIAHMAAGRRRH